MASQASRAIVATPPWAVLVALVVVQWVSVIVATRSIRHNGWLFYNGGDHTYYYTSAWLLSGGHIPQAVVGYGYTLLIAPFARIGGPSLIDGLPAIELFNVLVLLPLGLLAVYGIASKIGGRAIGYLAGAVWTLIPFASVLLLTVHYTPDYVDLFLPQALGLTVLGDFPSMICILGAAFFALRAVERGRFEDAITAGMLTGFAIGIKPANGVFVIAPAVAFAIAGPRRWPHIPAYGVALAPALWTLAEWKRRGLGVIPLEATGTQRFALGGLPPQYAPDRLRVKLHQYAPLDWHHLHVNLDQFYQVFWSVRLLEWVFVAGLLAVCRRSLAHGALIGIWFLTYLLLKGSSIFATVFSTSFFRLTMPAFPALIVMATMTPLLIPRVGRRFIRAAKALSDCARGARITAVVSVVVLGILPAGAVATAKPFTTREAVRLKAENVYVPVSGAFHFRAAVADVGSVRLRWAGRRATATRPFYAVFRSRYNDGITCDVIPGASSACHFGMRPVALTRENVFIDHPPVQGRWFYRVGLLANWDNSIRFGTDLLLVSTPARIILP